MKKSFLLFLWLGLSSSLPAQLTEHIILPSQTDPMMDGNNVPHYAYLNPEITPIQQLLLFFPGTNATPWDYRLFQQTAADMGYHVIGLSYENLESINLEVCPGTHDSTCHRRARYEIWFGEDTHDSLQVTPANAVVNRVLKLLGYLANSYPTENWGQYLLNDSTVNWSNVVTAGHSQGAGNAAFGSKYFQVSRVIMFSWVDWMWPGKNPDWINTPGPTQDSTYFGFIHTGDASIYYGIPTTWNNLGMLSFGPITSIDTSEYPYHLTHSLVTSMAIDALPTQTNYHNSTVVDWRTPIDGNTGEPKLKPVWEYLLNVEPVSTHTEESHSHPALFTFFPNPVEDLLFVRAPVSLPTYRVCIYNTQGVSVFSAENATIIDCSGLPGGVYWVKVDSRDGVFTQIIVKS